MPGLAPDKREVGGSNPSGPTNTFLLTYGVDRIRFWEEIVIACRRIL